MKKVLFLFTCTLIISSCGKLSYAPSRQSQNYSSIATPSQIVIYPNENPKKAFEEIGVLHYDGNSKRIKIENLMKIEASKQGGNAIIGIKQNSVGMVATVVKIKE